jgi:competence protein ComEA
MQAKSFIATVALLFALVIGPAYAAEPMTVNINTADAATLASLNGIGQSKAEAIIVYREANGPFESVEQLVEVKGIGSRTVEKNASQMAVK